MSLTWITDTDWYAVMPAASDFPEPQLIRLASQDVALFIRSGIYEADAQGLPTDTALRASVVAAVVEQTIARGYAAATRKAAAASPLGRALDMAQIGGTIWKASTAAAPDGYELTVTPGSHTLCANARAYLLDFPRLVTLYG